MCRSFRAGHWYRGCPVPLRRARSRSKCFEKIPKRGSREAILTVVLLTAGLAPLHRITGSAALVQLAWGRVHGSRRRRLVTSILGKLPIAGFLAARDHIRRVVFIVDEDARNWAATFTVGRLSACDGAGPTQHVSADASQLVRQPRPAAVADREEPMFIAAEASFYIGDHGIEKRDVWAVGGRVPTGILSRPGPANQDGVRASRFLHGHVVRSAPAAVQKHDHRIGAHRVVPCRESNRVRAIGAAGHHLALDECLCLLRSAHAATRALLDVRLADTSGTTAAGKACAGCPRHGPSAARSRATQRIAGTAQRIAG